MGCDSYQYEICKERFYDRWVGCDVCHCGCEEWMNIRVCLKCFRNDIDDRFDMYKLDLTDDLCITMCCTCNDELIDSLYKAIRKTAVYDEFTGKYYACGIDFDLNIEH